MLTALIEASLAVVSKDKLLSIWQGRIVDQDRQPGTTFRADRADRHEHIRRASIDAGAGSPQPPLMHRQKEIALALSAGPPSVPSTAAVYVLDQSGCVEVRHWCKHQRLHQCGH
jgi:hypothetical protein